LPCPAGRSAPGRGGPERQRRPRPDGTGRAAAPSATACQRCSGHRGRASPTVEVGANASRSARVILAGRATSVPFTAFPTGTERTTTDNAKAASPSAVGFLRRSQSRPIWLWEQVVPLIEVCIGLGVPGRPADPVFRADPVAGKEDRAWGAPEIGRTGRTRTPSGWASTPVWRSSVAS
jgi:hypothetical protein